MTETELAVVGLGLLAGYWFVSSSMGKTKPRTDEAGPSDSSRHESPGTHSPPGSNGAGAQQADTDIPPHAAHPRLWNEILGVPASATREEICRAYKSRISQYHPDKVTRMGPEIREVAEQKSKEINDAYRAALER